jgi:type I restriction enzyme S subunit
MGPFGSRIKTDNFVPSGVPIIRGNNLNAERFFDDDFVYLTEKKADELRASNAFPGDIVITHRGTLGQVGIIPYKARYSRYVVSQSQMKLTTDQNKVDPFFVFYFLRSPQGQHALLANTSQTVVPAIAQPTTSLKTISMPLPSLQEQRVIAHILGTLDDKIELNRRMNETLEAMARAIFKSWFVDFDPVHAKMEGRDPGLPKEIADLFPDRLVDSELGKIPEGWRVRKIDEEFNLIMGQSPPGETYNEIGEGVPFHQGRADFGFRFPSRRVYCTTPTRFAEAGDTLISVRAPVGDINLAAEHCCIGRGVAAVRHKSGSRSYTYYFMYAIKEVLDRFEAEGTVFGSISKKDFHNIQHIVPPKQAITAFEHVVASIDDRIMNNDKESHILATLRDTLLPKLISGDLRVKDAERMIGRHR